MPYLIGTDEAGYGPNLGPLVIGASLWRLPEVQLDLYEILSEVICRNSEPDDDRMTIADSKVLYQSGQSIEELEESVLAVLLSTEQYESSFQHLCRRMNGIDLDGQRAYDWNCTELPLAADWSRTQLSADRFARACQASGVRCQQLRSTVVFPDAFNRGLKTHGNKATLLTTETCRLISQLLEACDDDVTIVCDKHGGRGYYAALLQQEMTESFVRVCRESRECSEYQWKDSGKTINIRFLAGGERVLPVALASMLAKYFREVSMRAWNAFWTQYLPKLHPTAGYPGDSRRFKSEIARQQQLLGISDLAIWRSR